MYKKVESEVKDVLYQLYLSDISFPRSCGAVSMAIACILQTKDYITSKYDVMYHRGHFRNDNEYEFCYCDIADLNCLRFSKDIIATMECLNCSCDYMVGHSWVELIDKETKDVTILDYTSIQFAEDFPDYQIEILENEYTKDEIFNYLKLRSCFYVHKDNVNFDKYIKSERELSGEYILKTVKDTYKENAVSDLTIILDKIKFKIEY